MMPQNKDEVKPIIARDDQEGRMIGDVCHVEGCPCEDCAAAERAFRERYAKARGEELEPEEDTEARLARILAAWADMAVNQREIALAFVLRFDGQLWPEEYRFDARRGRWMEFKGEHWAPAHTILDAVGELVEALCGDNPSNAAKWGKLNVYRDVLALAQEHLTIDQWDAYGSLLGLPNGELWDLETGYAMPNFRRLPITKTTGADPDEYQSKRICRSGCECLWHSFLDDTTGGDMDMAEGLRVSVGASLFGGNRDHRLNVVTGDGGTGKSVFLNAISRALGSYAGALPASVLASKGNDHPTGLAGVVDKRFVVVPEVSGGMWKEETLKTISGGDSIPVRYMRQDFFVVQPDCTLWVSTNAPPALRMVDNAIRRRIRIWPFTHKPKDVDPRLGEKLQEPAMMGKVLQWALSGAETYAKLEGEIPDCEAVTLATRDYFSDVDTIAGWLEAGTTESHIPEHDTSASAAFKHYSAWCESEGQWPVSRTAWGTSMGRRVEWRRSERGKFYSIELEVLAENVGSMLGSHPNPTSSADPDLATKQGSF